MPERHRYCPAALTPAHDGSAESIGERAGPRWSKEEGACLDFPEVACHSVPSGLVGAANIPQTGQTKVGSALAGPAAWVGAGSMRMQQCQFLFDISLPTIPTEQTVKILDGGENQMLYGDSSMKTSALPGFGFIGAAESRDAPVDQDVIAVRQIRERKATDFDGPKNSKTACGTHKEGGKIRKVDEQLFGLSSFQRPPPTHL